MEPTNPQSADSNIPPETKVEVKEEPEPTVLSNTDVQLLRISKVKKEEPDDDKVDISIPEARNGDDMFEDVDGPEVVDLTYEGIAEINGVDHFVCEGPLIIPSLAIIIINAIQTSKFLKFQNPR